MNKIILVTVAVIIVLILLRRRRRGCQRCLGRRQCALCSCTNMN